MARNGVHSGGRKKARYYKVWDKENGKYKGIWRIGARQNCIHALFYYERLEPKTETGVKFLSDFSNVIINIIRR